MKRHLNLFIKFLLNVYFLDYARRSDVLFHSHRNEDKWSTIVIFKIFWAMGWICIQSYISWEITQSCGRLNGPVGSYSSLNGTRCLHVMHIVRFNDNVVGKIRKGSNSACFVRVTIYCLLNRMKKLRAKYLLVGAKRPWVGTKRLGAKSTWVEMTAIHKL